MAYFDNAATTYPKPDCVYDFMDSFYRSSGANAGRGNYKLAQSAGALIGDTRKKIQELLHCQAKQVVFEPTATIALNIIIQGIIEKGAVNIYISPFEHNAVIRTLHHFEEQEKIKVTQLTVSKGMVYDLEKIRYQFDTVKPDFVIVSHASNVFGLIAPVEDIFALAKKYEAITLVDMAQTAGLVDLNVGRTTIDFAVFAGHKTLYEGKLWAYYRQLSGKEFFAAATVNAEENVLFTVNYRTDIETDMIVEYAGEYYQITRIDDHEGYKTDIDLYCKTNPEQHPNITEE